MEERALGLVLRTRPLTETSLIVQWLTPEFGRLDTVARGALRPKSPFRGKLDLYYRAEFSFQRSRRSPLHQLREVRLQETHAALRRNVEYLRQAAYCAALIEQTTETETPLEGPFQLLDQLLAHLPPHEPQALTVFAFEMKLLAELGIAPDLRHVRLDPPGRALLEKLPAIEWPELFQLRPSAAELQSVRQFLHGFLIYHLGKIPRQRLGRGDVPSP